MSTGPFPDVRWLIEHADEELSRGDLPSDPLKLAARFRKRHSRQRSQLLCELVALRAKAAAKFARAKHMFFTKLGLEQATDEVLARYKARRFAHHPSICDLCCGIGGDAIGLAQTASEPITIIDLAPEHLAIARANLRVYGALEPQAVARDILSCDLSPFAAWHIDPDRRLDQRKRSEPEACSPPLSEILRLPGMAADGAIKLSPAAKVGHLLTDGCELEWIGHQRECQQLVAWFGGLAEHPGSRTATWIWTRDDQLHCEKLVGRADEQLGELAATPRFLYEPRPTVLAAGLADSLALQLGLRRLTWSVPYFAAEQLIESSLVQRFEIVDTFPFRTKTLERKLRHHDGYLAEVKKRGVDVRPEDLLRSRATRSGRPLVLLLYREQQSTHAVLATRIG